VGILAAHMLQSQKPDHEEIQAFRLDWDCASVWKLFEELMEILILNIFGHSFLHHDSLLFWRIEERERGKHMGSILCIFSLFFSWRWCFFSFFPIYASLFFFLSIFFSTIAHMSWWMESEKIKEMSWGQKVMSEFGDAQISGWEFGIFIWWKAKAQLSG